MANDTSIDNLGISGPSNVSAHVWCGSLFSVLWYWIMESFWVNMVKYLWMGRKKRGFEGRLRLVDFYFWNIKGTSSCLLGKVSTLQVSE